MTTPRQRIATNVTAMHAPTVTRRHGTTPAIEAARHRLTEWSGGYATETYGAAPSTTRSPANDHGDHEPDGPIHPPDTHRRLLGEMDELYARLTALAINLAGPMSTTDPLLFPTGAHLLRFVYVEGRGTRLDGGALTWACGASQRIVDIITDCSPVSTERGGETCRAHQAAGDPHEPVHSTYARFFLCQRCGRFRASHTNHNGSPVAPHPNIVKHWAKGGRGVPASMLRDLGIKRAA